MTWRIGMARSLCLVASTMSTRSCSVSNWRWTNAGV